MYARVYEDRRRHILDGDASGGGHRYGTGHLGKTEFPATWDDDTVSAAIESVANDSGSERRLRWNGRTDVRGMRHGVEIRVIVDADGVTIRTAHPTNLPLNR